MKSQDTAQTIRVAGQSLCYRRVGRGDPLVLIHGFATSGLMWQGVLPYLAQHYEVFLLDLPGHGGSQVSGPWRLREVAPVLIRWLQEMGLSGFSLLGHSMGGAICIDLAATAPEMINKLILADAAGLPLQANLLQLAIRSVRSALQPGNGRYPTSMLREMLIPRPRLWWQCAQEMMKCDLRQEIQRINIPTLIIWGEHDLMIPLSMGDALRRDLPHASFEIMPHCGHRSMIAQPAAFSQVVLDFLERTATSPGREV